MAELKKVSIEVAKVSIPVMIKSDLASSVSNDCTLIIGINGSRCCRFLRRLMRLCKRFGYDLDMLAKPN